MAEVSRPLSPHLQIWRWGWNMALSILHRATGLAGALAAVLLVWWLAAVALGPDTYDFFLSVVLTPIGRAVLFLVTLAVTFHALTGVRHLLMDTGALLEKGAARKAGVVIILAAIILSVGIWVLAYWYAGLI